jgi:polysaccharide transporter, PST family
MTIVSPVGLVRPRLSWRGMQPLLGFGVRFQAASMTWLIRDQGLNAAVAAIAGTVTLGFWTLARRLLEVPLLLFESLIRVSFPTMSQLVARNENPARLIERGAGMTVVAGGLFLTGLAGGAPGLIPGLFGQQWEEASAAIPGACLGLALGASVAAATQGYLYAVGDANVPLRASVYQTIVWFGVTLPLLPSLGVVAIGLGWCASAMAESWVLTQGVQKWTRARVLQAVAGPIVLGIVASALGWLVAEFGGKTLLSGIAGGVLASVLFLLGLLVFRRKLLLETYRFAGQSMRAALSRRALTGVP